MSTETGQNPEKIEIDYIKKESYTGKEIDRMRETPVPGGGNQLSHLGEFSKYPRPPIPRNIDFTDRASYTNEDLDRMKRTPVPGGRNQLTHLREFSPLPIEKAEFIDRVLKLQRIRNKSGHNPDKLIHDAKRMVAEYETAGSQGLKQVQSEMVREIDMQLVRAENPPKTKRK